MLLGGVRAPVAQGSKLPEHSVGKPADKKESQFKGQGASVTDEGALPETPGVRQSIKFVGVGGESSADGKPTVKIPDMARKAFGDAVKILEGSLNGTSSAKPDAQISFLRKEIKAGNFTPEMAGELAKEVDNPMVLLELAGKLDRNPKQDKSATSAFKQSQSGDLGKVMAYIKRAESTDKKSGAGSRVKAEFMKKALGSPDLVRAGLKHAKGVKAEFNVAFDQFFDALLDATGEDPLDFGERLFLYDLPTEQLKGPELFFRDNTSLSSKFLGSQFRASSVDVSNIDTDKPYESAMKLLGSDAVSESPVGKLIGRMMSVTSPSGSPPVGTPADVLVSVMTLKGIAPKMILDGSSPGGDKRLIMASKTMQKTANAALNGTADRGPLDAAVKKYISGSLSEPLNSEDLRDASKFPDDLIDSLFQKAWDAAPEGLFGYDRSSGESLLRASSDEKRAHMDKAFKLVNRLLGFDQGISSGPKPVRMQRFLSEDMDVSATQDRVVSESDLGKIQGSIDRLLDTMKGVRSKYSPDVQAIFDRVETYFSRDLRSVLGNPQARKDILGEFLDTVKAVSRSFSGDAKFPGKDKKEIAANRSELSMSTNAAFDNEFSIIRKTVSGIDLSPTAQGSEAPVVNRGAKPAITMTTAQAAEQLQDGQYVVRNSSTQPGLFSVSYRDNTGQIHHQRFNEGMDIGTLRDKFTRDGYSPLA